MSAGESIYNEKCSSCHAALENSAKKWASSDRITAAIASVPEMAGLKNMSKQDIADVAQALADDKGEKANGVTLYVANCAACHGALPISQKRDRSASQIKTAIANQPTMSKIKLSDQEIEMIAKALSSVEQNLVTSGMPELRDRTMLASRLKRVFAPTDPTQRQTIERIIDEEVLKHPEAFGGNCSRSDAKSKNDSACPFASGFEAYGYANSYPIASLSRSWRLDRACKAIAAQTFIANLVATKLGTTTKSPPTEEQMIKFANLMSPGYSPGDDAKSSFTTILTSATQAKYSAATQWQLMIYGVCGSLATEKL